MNIEKPDPNAVGRRLRTLRRQCNMTQAALAARVGIGTGPLNTLENGHHLPSLPVLCQLAQVLDVDVNQILFDPIAGGMVRETPPQYGSQVRNESTFSAEASRYDAINSRIIRFEPCKKALAKETVRQLDQVMKTFLALEDICEVQKHPTIPLKLKLPTTEIGLQRFTARVRSLLGISDAVIFDYLELFENAGLRVVFLPMPEGVESVSCYDRQCENAFFFIATGHSAERQLFRLCYELGRIYLHNGGMAGGGKIGSLDADHAARRFAALFLMPEEAVITTVRQVGFGPGQWTWEMLLRLKHRFGVSAEAFLYRLGELDLIDSPRLKTLKEQIHAHYQTHANTEPDSTRRVLTPNGRLGDLLLAAERRQSGEMPDLHVVIDENGIVV